MFNKCVIQFSVDGWGCVPSLLFDLRLNYAGSNENNGNLLQKGHARTAVLNAPSPAAGHRQPTLPPENPGHSQASLSQSLVGSLLLSSGSWFTQGFVCVLQESVSSVLCKFCNQIPLASKVKFPGVSQSLCQIPRLKNPLGSHYSVPQCFIC